MTARIAVIGGGAVGTVIAAAGEQAGHEVLVCVRRGGGPLVLDRGGRRRRLGVEVIDDPASAGPVDWVFIATKAYDAAPAQRWLPALLAPATAVVVCQNGIDHAARVGAFAGRCRVLPAVVSIVAQRDEAGVVVHRQGSTLTVADDADGVALAALFASTDELDIVLSRDLGRSIWLKFLGNIAAAPITTLTMRALGVMRDPELRWLIERLLAEAVEVGSRAGVDLRMSDVDDTVAALIGLDPMAQTSMQADRAAGRPLETEFLTGELVRRADLVGVPVPYNRTMLALLRHLATSEGQ